MESGTVLTVFVAITALAFLGQAIGVLLIYRKISEITRHVNQLSGEVREKIQQVTNHVAEVSRTFKPLGEQLQTISANLASVSKTIRTRTEDVDYFVGQTTEALRNQVGQISEFLTNTTLRFEDTANVVQRGIVAPINELAAMVKGLKVGIGLLFSRWPANAARRPAPNDEELFI